MAFSEKKLAEMTSLVFGKTIVKIEDYDNSGRDYLVFTFSDDTELRIRYDWIYDWELRKKVMSEENG
jgi:hypothetical protein